MKKCVYTIVSLIPAMMLFVFLSVTCFFMMCDLWGLKGLYLINRTSTQIVLDSYTIVYLKLVLTVSCSIVAFFLFLLLRKRYWFFGSLIIIACSVFFFIRLNTISTAVDNSVVISEICASHAELNLDVDYSEQSDYLEIYNGTSYDVDITGWTVSIGDEDPIKIENPLLMRPNEYYLIVFNNKFREQSAMKNIPYVYENLPVEGECVRLIDDVGKIVDQVDYPQLLSKHVYARILNNNMVTGSYWALTGSATPGWSNSEVVKEILPEPEFSNDSGFYENGFYLSISTSDEGTIYYTLDGSAPTANDNVYSEPIYIDNNSDKANQYNNIRNVVYDWNNYQPSSEPVDKGTVVRAIVIDDNGNCSDIVSKTYFVDLDQYETMKVISLIIEPDDLFGDSGIYVTGSEYDDWYLDKIGEEPVPNFMKDKTREAFCEFFDDNGDVFEKLDLEIKLQGASARLYPKKRIALTAKDSVSGQHFFLSNIFDYRIHSINLRDDWYDAVLQKIAATSNMKLGCQDAEPAVLFINGEYWYDTYIRPRYNELQISQWFNIRESDVYYVKDIPLEVSAFLSKNSDLSDKNTYDAFSEILDIDDYVDFMATNIYFCNMDLYDHKNVRMWKNLDNNNTLAYDTKWHYLLYDMDCFAWVDTDKCGGVNHSYEIDSFSSPRMYSEKGMDQDLIFKAIKNNPEFRQKFVTRFLDLSNTAFSMEQVSPILKEYGLQDDVIDSFFIHRFEYIVPALAKEFNLSGTLNSINLSVNDSNAGQIKCNTVEVDFGSDLSWEGKYYSDFPLTIEAVSNEGYEFLYWETPDGEHISDSTLDVDLIKNESYKAVFKK